MIIDKDYHPRKYANEIRDSIGRKTYFENHATIADILEARKVCMEIIKETNDFIDQKLKEIDLPGIQQVVLVPEEDPTVLVRLVRDIAGQFQLDVQVNDHGYEPDVLSVKHG